MWRCLESDEVIPDSVALEEFLYTDFCIVATEEVTKDTGGDTDAEDGEAQSNLEVLDAVGVLRRYARSTGQQHVMQSLSAYERSVRPSLTAKDTQGMFTR